MAQLDMTRRRSSKRKSITRHIEKRIIIATEGSETEPQYFESLRKEFKLRNVKLLKRSKTKSSPSNVIASLDKEKSKIERKYGKNKKDEYWVVIDKDEWQLEKVVEQIETKDYRLADSNPCFELWLLLHYESLDRLRGLEGSAATGGCASVEKELKKFDETYNKSRYEPGKYIEKINKAIKNAKETDTQPDDRWLNQIGTRVYRLAQSIIASAPSAKHLNN